MTADAFIVTMPGCGKKWAAFSDNEMAVVFKNCNNNDCRGQIRRGELPESRIFKVSVELPDELS